ncbi:branched-chain amino acid ABC transporter substrate-binding protein [Advenella sp. RU8]|uniref:branched-chain amino acid ABC transporter substrate-binding protein n=1 Tax=Advenella sp. RU8 TaxID=3399575 RepID=UPI003AAAB341
MNKGFKKLFITAALTTAFSAPAMAEEFIKIGLGAPITGGSAAFGKQLLVGAEAAAEAINAKGGVHGKKIKIIQGDDACEPKQAVAVANRFVDQEKVDAVVGHFCSSSTIPASEIYDEANILSVTPASTNPRVTERDLTTLIRVCGRDDQQGEVDAKFIHENLKAKRIAVINDKDTYGVGLANATRDAAKKLGVEVVLEDGVTRGERDYNALVTKIKASDVGAVFFGGLYAEAGLLVKQMRQQGLTIPFVSDDGIADPAFVTAAGGAPFAEGTYMSFLKDPRGEPAAQEVLVKLKEKGSDAEGFTLYSYAAVEAIAAAMEANKDVKDGTKLADWIKNNEIDTVLGRKGWDQKGDPKTNDFIIYVWNKDGQYVPLK